jgi:hypothetical protein
MHAKSRIHVHLLIIIVHILDSYTFMQIKMHVFHKFVLGIMDKFFITNVHDATPKIPKNNP